MEVAKKKAGRDIPCYTDFGRMLDETEPDTVIVTGNKRAKALEFIPGMKSPSIAF